MALTRTRKKIKDPRKANPALRAALRAKVFAQSDVCGICGRPVDKSLPAYHPLAPELDEIIPVARGGSPYALDNLQLVHRECNRRKGAKMVGDVDLEKIENPAPVSRGW